MKIILYRNFFTVGLVFELRAFTLAKQALYHLSHTSSPFCSGYFGDGDIANYLPRLASKLNPSDFSLANS
jgi:hypothetical protein